MKKIIFIYDTDGPMEAIRMSLSKRVSSGGYEVTTPNQLDEIAVEAMKKYSNQVALAVIDLQSERRGNLTRQFREFYNGIVLFHDLVKNIGRGELEERKANFCIKGLVKSPDMESLCESILSEPIKIPGIKNPVFYNKEMYQKTQGGLLVPKET